MVGKYGNARSTGEIMLSKDFFLCTYSSVTPSLASYTLVLPSFMVTYLLLLQGHLP